jgi:hypothetical protein
MLKILTLSCLNISVDGKPVINRRKNKCRGRSLENGTEVAFMDKRTEYAERLSTQMVEWDMQIEQLKIKATNATPEARLEYSNAIAELKQKRDEAAEKLKGISAASDDEWEELKTGAEQVWGDIRTMLRDAIKKIK